MTIAERARNLKGHGLEEGISTRMLIYAGSLIGQGVEPVAACHVSLIRPITDDADIRDALGATIRACFLNSSEPRALTQRAQRKNKRGRKGNAADGEIGMIARERLQTERCLVDLLRRTT